MNNPETIDADTIAIQELEHLRTVSLTKPDIIDCIPETYKLAVKTVMRQNLTLDPSQGLVYIKTRNVKIKDVNGKDTWAKALEIMPSANGLISIARQCGRIIDIERPIPKTDDNGKVVGVSVRIKLPSGNETRWENFIFDESDIFRWRRASHKEMSRNKPDANNEIMNYANDNYTNWKGGIDPEFARAKAIRHSLKKLGTNYNESRVIKISSVPKEIYVDVSADEQAYNDEVGYTNVEVIDSNEL
ncbi:MAG: hypothetical protein K9G64_08980 [Bacteroidia bacterium]|nr:hypothetical protein [Bacteroidia bacterium]